MSFLRNERSIVRWEDGFGSGAKQTAAQPQPSHRRYESQPVVPWRVALQQSPPPLHQPAPSSRQPAATVNHHPQWVADFSTGVMGDYCTGVDWAVESLLATLTNGRESYPFFALL